MTYRHVYVCDRVRCKKEVEPVGLDSLPDTWWLLKDGDGHAFQFCSPLCLTTWAKTGELILLTGLRSPSSGKATG